MTDAIPTELQRVSERELQIAWSDGERRRYLLSDLREKCPCATCRELRSAPPEPSTMLPVISAAEAQPLRLDGMKPVGNYAYSLEFSDGHDTGIYSFELLRKLGEVVT